MRNTFAEQLTKIASADRRVFLISGDIGNKLFDEFKESFPDRFFNAGIAEQNMMSLAAGLASTGFVPVVYTIASFATARCYEQIKLDVCYHNTNVVIVGTGAGLSYASLGPTHYALEDVAIMRVLPNMAVVAPGDVNEVGGCLHSCISNGGPSYLRLGKKGEPRVHDELQEVRFGQWIKVNDGQDMVILATGTALALASELRRRLTALGVDVALLSCPFIKPLAEDQLRNLIMTYDKVVTLEEHDLVGGFGSAILEWCESNALSSNNVLRLGTANFFPRYLGSQVYTRDRLGLSTQDMVNRISERWNI